MSASENEQLEDAMRNAEAAYKAASRRFEKQRQARNEAIRHALREGWTHAQIADATGLTRSRVGQIAISTQR